MFRVRAAALLAGAVLTLGVAVTNTAVANPAVAASGQRVTVLQFNASEGTATCPDPSTDGCLSVLGGSNANRDMYAVEELCRSDYVSFTQSHPGWSAIFHVQTERRTAAAGTCKKKGQMVASPHRITDAKVYRLSSGFTVNHVRHDYKLLCGLIHAAPSFYGCATHLVYPRPDRSQTQVRAIVRDTAAYRSAGRVVVAGDFNIGESGAGAGATPRLKPITGAGYQETDKDKTPTHRSKKFDYIFYFGSGGVRQRAALTGDVATSDHRVLLGEARI